MNKETLIDDYKQTIERLQKECTEKTDFNIKLMERVKELEEKLNAQFAEMEEKLTAEENKNYELQDKLIIVNAKHVEYIIETNEKIVKLRKKLKIAEEALNDIKNSFFEDEDKEIITHAESIYYYSKARETLQKMKETNNDNNINLN